MKHANGMFFRQRLVAEGIVSVVLMIAWAAFVSVSLAPGLAA